jgi:hypothetical protein
MLFPSPNRAAPQRFEILTRSGTTFKLALIGAKTRIEEIA